MKNILVILLMAMVCSCAQKSADEYYNLACDEEEKENFELAIKYLDSAIKLNPKDIHAYNNRGYDYLELKKHALAETNFKSMIALDEKCIGAYYGLGILNLELKNYQKSISFFDEVIRLKGGGPLFLEYNDNPYFKSPYSMDVAIGKVYRYKKMAEEELKKMKHQASKN